MNNIDKKLDDALLKYTASLMDGLNKPHFPREEQTKIFETAKESLKALMSKFATEIIGEDYIFERPLDDYLPNVVQFLKGKN